MIGKKNLLLIKMTTKIKIWLANHKNLVINCLLVMFGLAVALVAGELAVRILHPSLVKSDPILGNVARPIGDRDANGFRNAQVLKTAEIVALGDSQTEGNNATREEAWPQVLGQLSHKTVYQMALGGWNSAQAYYLYDQALELKPKVIVFSFYFGNDLIEAQTLVYSKDYWQAWRQKNQAKPVASSSPINYRLVLQSGLEPGSFRLTILAGRNWLRNHFKLYELLGNSTRSLREALNLAPNKVEKQTQVEALAKKHPEIAYFYEEEPVSSLLSPGYRVDTVDIHDPLASDGWRLTQEFIKGMKAKADKSGVIFVLNVIPTKEMVYLNHSLHTTGQVPELFNNYYAKETELAQTVKTFCFQQGLNCHFSLPALTSGLDNHVVIYGRTMDGHPIAAGYKLIAESVNNYLQRYFNF